MSKYYEVKKKKKATEVTVFRAAEPTQTSWLPEGTLLLLKVAIGCLKSRMRMPNDITR